MYDWRIYIVLILSLCALCWLMEKPFSGQIANDADDTKERFSSCSSSHPGALTNTTRDLYPVKKPQDDDDVIKENFENYETTNNTSTDPSSLSMGPKMSIYGSSAPIRGIGAIINTKVSNDLSNVYVYKTDQQEAENPAVSTIPTETPTQTPLEQTLTPPPEMPPIDIRVANLEEEEEEEETLAPRTLGTGGFPTPSVEEIREQKAELDRLLEQTITPPPLSVEPSKLGETAASMNLLEYSKMLKTTITPPPGVGMSYMNTSTPLPFTWDVPVITPTPFPFMDSRPTMKSTPVPILSTTSIKMDIDNVMQAQETALPVVFEEPLSSFGDEPLDAVEEVVSSAAKTATKKTKNMKSRGLR